MAHQMTQLELIVLERDLANMLYDHIHPHGCDLEALAAHDIVQLLTKYGVIDPRLPVENS